MENASKALLMAGGILISLIVIGALLLMFNQLSAYQKAQSSGEKNSQLAEFNLDFEKYADDKGIDGTDLISLANKIIDYNKKSGISNSVDYDIKMSLTITKMDDFREKYAYGNNNEALFKADKYVISANQGNRNTLQEALEAFNNADRELLKKVSSIYDSDNESESIEKIKEALLEIDSNRYKNWNINKVPTLLQIKHYKEYSEFKTSKFKISRQPVYENGQIKDLYFEFVK